MAIQQMMLSTIQVMTATATPAVLTASGSTTTIDTLDTVVTVVGGSGHTYAWSKLSGDAITVLSPSTNITPFRATGLSPGEVRFAQFRCTVTAGSLTATADVSVTISRNP